MARITSVARAQASTKVRQCYRSGCRKDIQVGDPYKHASFKTGPYSSTTRYWCKDHPHPRASETTTNGRLSSLYGASEAVEDVLAGTFTLEDVASALEDAASTAEEVMEEYRESASNLEEHFSGSSQIDEINEKADACEEWATELTQAAEEIREWVKDEPEGGPKCETCDEEEGDSAHDKESPDFEHEFEEPEEEDEDDHLGEASDRAAEALAALSL